MCVPPSFDPSITINPKLELKKYKVNEDEINRIVKEILSIIARSDRQEG